jgi:hypothetical protein
MVFKRYNVRLIGGRMMRVPMFSQFLAPKTKVVFATPRRRKA